MYEICRITGCSRSVLSYRVSGAMWQAVFLSTQMRPEIDMPFGGGARTKSIFKLAYASIYHTYTYSVWNKNLTSQCAVLGMKLQMALKYSFALLSFCVPFEVLLIWKWKEMIWKDEQYGCSTVDSIPKN